MKTLILIVGVVIVGIGIGFYATRSQPASAASVIESAAVRQPPVTENSETNMSPAAPAGVGLPVSPVKAHQGEPLAAETAPAKAAPSQPAPGELALRHSLATLVSPESSFEHRQAAWQQLRDSGKLDQAIAQLEQQAASDPTVAQYPANLGQAYLQKAGTIQDIREQGILGMKADQSFDLALKADPQNWDARFWKATALSYWPPQLGKGKEVIEHCVELIKLQETRPPQPEYAQVYVLLGEQYAREGYADYAREAWKRGAMVFPAHPVLAQKATANGTAD